ncbi:MAG: hypothetical protein ACREXT_15940 [Gammaproteobacteria bacterium]
MVVPIGEASDAQTLERVTKELDGTARREEKLPVQFVPLTGDNH